MPERCHDVGESGASALVTDAGRAPAGGGGTTRTFAVALVVCGVVAVVAVVKIVKVVVVVAVEDDDAPTRLANESNGTGVVVEVVAVAAAGIFIVDDVVAVDAWT